MKLPVSPECYADLLKTNLRTYRISQKSIGIQSIEQKSFV